MVHRATLSRRATGEPYLGANNSISTVEVFGVHMHGTSFTSGDTSLSPSQFRQYPNWRHSHDVGPSMGSVGSDCTVVRSECVLEAYSYSFLRKMIGIVDLDQAQGMEITNLSRIQVAKTSDNFVFVQVACRGFHTTNCVHLRVHFQCFVSG